MCAISNSIQWGDPYSQKIWQLQPPLSDPLPHPLGAERNLHTQCRGSTPWPSAQSQTHTHRQAGCGGIWEWYTAKAGELCVSISLFRNVNSFPQPSSLYPVPQAALWPTESISQRPRGSSNPNTMLFCMCRGAKMQKHLYLLTSQPLKRTFICSWLFYGPLPVYCWPTSESRSSVVTIQRVWDIIIPQHGCGASKLELLSGVPSGRKHQTACESVSSSHAATDVNPIRQ